MFQRQLQIPRVYTVITSMLCVAIVQMADAGRVNLQVWAYSSPVITISSDLTKNTAPDNQLQPRDDNVNIQRDRIIVLRVGLKIDIFVWITRLFSI